MSEVDWSKAPEGATHYCKRASGFRGHGDSLCSHCIPRPPKKAKEVEWEGGLPPVGCECEINPYGLWYRVTVLAYGNEKFLAEISASQVDQDGDTICGEHAHSISTTKFRPLRTKQQRQRDELIDFVSAQRGRLAGVDHRTACGMFADALIADGWKKEPKP